MNLLGMLTSWASGQLFGDSEELADAPFQLSGNSGWFALGSGQLSAHSGYVPLAPEQPRRAGMVAPRRGMDGAREAAAALRSPASGAGGSAGRLRGSPAAAGDPAALVRGSPIELRGSPSELRSSPIVLGNPARDRGKHGSCALDRASRVLKGDFFVPEGRWDVATGAARASRTEPVGNGCMDGFCPGGAEDGIIGRDRYARVGGRSFRPCRGGIEYPPAFHGLRDAQSRIAPPVATALDPSGVEESGPVFVPPTCRFGQVGACGVGRAQGTPTSQSRSRWHERHRALFAPAGRGNVATGEARASRAQPVEGERADTNCPRGAAEATHAQGTHIHAREIIVVRRMRPEGRHAPLASADQHAASGGKVRHGA